MTLTFTEVEAAYSALSQAANQHGLDWVVKQTESQIALGKIRTSKVRAKEITLRGSTEAEVKRVSKGRPAKFTVSDEYTAHEKLQILVEALQHAVSGVWQTASEVSTFISESIPNLSSVKFLPEGISKEPFALERHEIDTRRQSVEQFDALIQELKEAI